jgi:hypothetical protein
LNCSNGRRQSRVAVSVAYAVLMLLGIYAVVDHGLAVPDTLTWIVLTAALVAVGVLVGPPALFPPPALVLASVPAGYSDLSRYRAEIPIWVGVTGLAAPALGLALVGVLAGLLVTSLRAGPRRSGNHSAMHG